MADEESTEFAFDEIAMAHARHLFQLEQARASYLTRRDALMKALASQTARLVESACLEPIRSRFEAVGDDPVYATYVSGQLHAARAEREGDPDERHDGFWFGFLTDRNWTSGEPVLAFRGHLVFSLDDETSRQLAPAFATIAEEFGGEYGRGSGYTWVSVAPVGVEEFRVERFAALVASLPEVFAQVDKVLATVLQDLEVPA